MVEEDHDRLIRIDENVAALIARRDDHEDRLRSLEREKWLHRGGTAVLALLAAKLGFTPHP